MRRLLIVGFLGCLSSVGLADDASDLVGAGRFPQFRDLSGLPGGGFGLLANGELSILGAMALSTPIAYSVGPSRFIFSSAVRSQDSRFRFFNTDANDLSNRSQSDGTASAQLGIKTSSGNLTIGYMVLSSKFDSVMNAHFQPNFKNLGRFAIGVGIQNWTSRGQAAGDGFPEEDAKNSLSPYVAGTYDLGQGHFVTLGYGNTRFRGLFGSANYQISPTTKFFIENDTFNWNYGVGYSTPMPKWDASGRRVRLFTTLGMVRNTLATWSIGIGF